MNIGHILSYHAKYRPYHTAFICGDVRLNYKELYSSVNKIANALATAKVSKGSKVAMLLPNCRELWELYWAIAQIGAIAVPLSPLLRGRGLINQLNFVETQLLITNAESVNFVNEIIADLNISPKQIWITGEEYASDFGSFYTNKNCAPESHNIEPEISPDDLYNIIFSSGTTGSPKGIMLTHRIRANYMTLFGSFFRMTPESVVLQSGSIVFNGSFLMLMPVMFHGGTFILNENFNAKEIAHQIKNERVTHSILVPTQIISVLKENSFNYENLSSLQCILTVGAPLHKSFKEELNSRIPDVFYELYGLTEGFVTILDKTDFELKSGSVGKPPQFFEMKIVDELGRELPSGDVGEIIGKGPILMEGYYEDDIRTKEAIKDGWLYTGDLGYVDEDGYLFLVDRKKDMMISGSVNVYPKDIEGVIILHENVSEVAVIGIPDEKWGESPIAAVVLKTQSKSDIGELMTWINERVEARFHKIKDMIILESFPRNVAGKILKNEIKELYIASKTK